MNNSESQKGGPRIFVSYAQYDRTHSDRVLALANALAADGLDVELDQYHSHEMLHWPSWCAERLRPENTDFVLMVCSAEYRGRIEGRVNRDEGRGAFWEGRLIYDYLYAGKANERFVPLLLDEESEDSLPEVLSNWTRFRLRAFGLSKGDRGYKDLYHLLTNQPATRKPDRGEPVPLPPGPVSAQEPEMVRIEPGIFLMGAPAGEGSDDECPRHEVRIGRAFAIGKYPVTFEEYDRFAEAAGREKPYDAGWGRSKQPVINVSWDDAIAYVKWLCEQSGLHYRLPSEAEWEYACRAGTGTQWSFGDKEADVGEYAWYKANSDEKTHPVGQRKPNPWGLHDVHGNVSEWVQDCWHDSYEGAPTNGSAWQEVSSNDHGRRGVARGGSWKDKKMPNAARSLDMGKSGDGKRSSDVGFRVVKRSSDVASGRRVSRGGSCLDVPQYLGSAFRDRHEPDRRMNDVGFRLAQDL